MISRELWLPTNSHNQTAEIWQSDPLGSKWSIVISLTVVLKYNELFIVFIMVSRGDRLITWYHCKYNCSGGHWCWSLLLRLLVTRQKRAVYERDHRRPLQLVAFDFLVTCSSKCSTFVQAWQHRIVWLHVAICACVWIIYCRAVIELLFWWRY